jgi:ectoine hydroxylase-related dioxygenase (phytanoyl-CoA dioxygenase family)
MGNKFIGATESSRAQRSAAARRERPRPIVAREIASATYHVETRGYAVIEHFLGPSSVQGLKRSLGAALVRCRTTGGSQQRLNDRHHIHDLMVVDEKFRDLLEDARLQQLLAPHLGEHWVMYAASSSSVPPMGRSASSRIHVDSPRFQLGYSFNIGVIWTLDDYTDRNGCLEVLPGSHHSAEAPDQDLFDAGSTKVLCGAGSLILFNARLFHRTSVNFTKRWRHAMTMNACRSFMKPRMDWPRMIPNPIGENLQPQTRRILGFDTRVPASVDEFFLPSSQRLYKAGQG